jgi:hypothetical protein
VGLVVEMLLLQLQWMWWVGNGAKASRDGLGLAKSKRGRGRKGDRGERKMRENNNKGCLVCATINESLQ